MLHTITRKQFLSHLKEKKVENLSLINFFEKSLVRQRKYIFRMLKKKDAVVLLLSGGLDSIVCWGILMKEFGLHVYPLSFDRGEKKANKEEASIVYYSKYYQKHFSHLYHAPVRLPLNLQKVTLRTENIQNQLDAHVFLENVTTRDPFKNINSSLGSSLLFPIYAKLYAEYLFTTQFIKVRTIFCGVTPNDGTVIPHQTFTSLRSIMHHLCATTHDNDWQFASVIFEKEIGMYLDKSDLITWADKQQIPLEHTWTCSFGGAYQCGGSDCRSCVARRYAFDQAGVMDKTKYQSLFQQSIVGRVKHTLRSFFAKRIIIFLKRVRVRGSGQPAHT